MEIDGPTRDISHIQSVISGLSVPQKADLLRRAFSLQESIVSAAKELWSAQQAEDKQGEMIGDKLLDDGRYNPESEWETDQAEFHRLELLTNAAYQALMEAVRKVMVGSEQEE